MHLIYAVGAREYTAQTPDLSFSRRECQLSDLKSHKVFCKEYASLTNPHPVFRWQRLTFSVVYRHKSLFDDYYKKNDFDIPGVKKAPICEESMFD